MVINVFTNFMNAVNTSVFGRVSHSGQGDGDWGIGFCPHEPPLFWPKNTSFAIFGKPCLGK